MFTFIFALFAMPFIGLACYMSDTKTNTDKVWEPAVIALVLVCLGLGIDYKIFV